MTKKHKMLGAGIGLALMITIGGCERSPEEVPVSPSPTPAPQATPIISMNEMPLTLPLLDALFQTDEGFSRTLQERLQLSEQQVLQLKNMARAETVKLSESGPEPTPGATTAAGMLAKSRVAEIIGEEKTGQLSAYVREQWAGHRSADLALNPAPSPSPTTTPLVEPTGSPAPLASPSPSPAVVPSTMAYNVPADTRVIINAPAHQMDVFENGQLIKSYKVGVGYPEFPVPYGIREANSLIFNPTWTPPDEPWVEASGKVKVGQKVKAGDKLNPLGIVKIPVGLPSLIHGGKNPGQIGGFASHGCVGLTDEQAVDFAKVLGRLGGIEVTDEQISRYRKKSAETVVLKLTVPIPVEFRYDTIVVSDGRLHVYRDIYDRDTNTVENLRSVLHVYGVDFDTFPETERQQALAALEMMGLPPSGRPKDANLTEDEKEQRRERNIQRQRMTRTVKGGKEVIVDVTALAGKGYPAAVAMDSGPNTIRM